MLPQIIECVSSALSNFDENQFRQGPFSIINQILDPYYEQNKISGYNIESTSNIFAVNIIWIDSIIKKTRIEITL